MKWWDRMHDLSFLNVERKWKWSHSVVSDSLRPNGLLPTRLLRPWDFPGKNTGVGCHFLLKGIFPTQGLNPDLPYCRQMLYSLSHQGNWALSQFCHSPLSPSSRDCSSSSPSAIRVVASAYLRLLTFLRAILIPACASSSPAFLMMYSACKLNKQGDNIDHWHTPFPTWNHSVVSCTVLTVASWPSYRFLKSQVRWSGIPISFRIFHSSLWSNSQRLWYCQ